MKKPHIRISPSTKKAIAVAALTTAISLLLADASFAADGTTDFSTVYERLSGWAGGALGKTLALAFLLVGLSVGLLRGSLVGALSCCGAALALVTVPSIINSIFTGA